MKYEEYELICSKTAIYPEELAAPYLALGLCSEAAELTQTKTRTEYVKELGDCQWYITRLANHYGFTLRGLAQEAALYAPTTDAERQLIEQAGLLAGLIKKQIRDGAKWTGEEREESRQKVRGTLISCTRHSMALARGEYTTVLRKNAEKLLSRMERGKLRGSGDNR